MAGRGYHNHQDRNLNNENTLSENEVVSTQISTLLRKIKDAPLLKNAYADGLS